MTKLFSAHNTTSLLGLSFALMLMAMPAQAQQNAFEDLSLNGLAAYMQLRKEYYIGGLYLPSLSQESEAAISISGKKRIQIRVTIDRWSPRSFAQQWNQLILINNDQESLNEFADQILAFIDIPKDDLMAGDIITVDMDPDRGTTVYLDEVIVFKDNSSGFFDILLNTWIGQRPPSTGFKNDILTLPTDQEGTQLLVRYEAISADKTRKATIAKWFKADETTETVASSTSSSVAVAPPGTNTTVSIKRAGSSKPAPALAVSKAAEVTAKVAAPKVVFEKPKMASNGGSNMEPAPAVKPEQITAAKPEPKLEPKTEPKLEPKVQPAPVAKTADKAPTDNLIAAKESTEATEQAKLLSGYNSSILKLTYLNTQYPSRARDFKQEGLVVLKIKVNREGEVIDINEETSSKYKLLNHSARKAVKKTAPYPQVPKTLVGEDFEFTLPFNFKLQ